jgi:hypothetical protein
MNPKRQQRALGFTAMLLGVLALIVPLWPEFAPNGGGGLLVLAACIEIFHGFRRSAHPRATPRGSGPPSLWPWASCL